MTFVANYECARCRASTPKSNRWEMYSAVTCSVSTLKNRAKIEQCSIFDASKVVDARQCALLHCKMWLYSRAWKRVDARSVSGP